MTNGAAVPPRAGVYTILKGATWLPYQPLPGQPTPYVYYDIPPISLAPATYQEINILFSISVANTSNYPPLTGVHYAYDATMFAIRVFAPQLTPPNGNVVVFWMVQNNTE